MNVVQDGVHLAKSIIQVNMIHEIGVRRRRGVWGGVQFAMFAIKRKASRHERLLSIVWTEKVFILLLLSKTTHSIQQLYHLSKLLYTNTSVLKGVKYVKSNNTQLSKRID